MEDVEIISNEEKGSQTDLTLLKGVGSATEVKLKKAGFGSIEQIANSTIESLCEVENLGWNKSESILASAREICGENETNKDTQTEETLNIFEANEAVEVIKEESTEFEFEKLPEGLSSASDALSPKMLRKLGAFIDGTEQTDLFKNEISPQYDFEYDDEQEEEEKEKETESENLDFIASFETKFEIIEDNTQIEFQNQRNLDENDEILETSDLNEMVKKTESTLKKLGFSVIPKSARSVNGVDLLAIKLKKVAKSLKTITFFPILLCNLKGSIVASESKLKYYPVSNELTNNSRAKKLLVEPTYKNLSRAQKSVFWEFISEKKLFSYVKKKFDAGLSIKRTIKGKSMFLKSGKTQYDIIIDPILVCKKKAKSEEKVSLFAYQRGSNAHIVKFSELSSLIDFLERKHEVIKSHIDSKNAIKSHFTSKDKLLSTIIKYSIPFLLFGTIFLIVIAAQLSFLIRTFASLAYASVVVYSLLIAYLYYKFYKNKSEIISDFHSPYYAKVKYLDDSDLSIIEEEFSNQKNSEKTLEQFGYECFGREEKFELREDRGTNFPAANIEELPIAESEGIVFRKGKPTEEEDMSNGYSQFLED